MRGSADTAALDSPYAPVPAGPGDRRARRHRVQGAAAQVVADRVEGHRVGVEGGPVLAGSAAAGRR